MSVTESISTMKRDVGKPSEFAFEFPILIHDVKQGEDDWHALRLGIPTGSQFSRIVTPTGKLSESRHKLMAELIAERYIGQAKESFTSAAMERGKGMEAEAVAHYAAKRRMDPVRVGFVSNAAKTIGVSPDSFLGDDELLEVKCPNPENHMAYLMASIDGVKRKSVAQEYKPQVQGQLWLTGRQRCVTLSYCPGFPPAVLEAERDDKYIELLATEVSLFSADLERIWLELCEAYPQYRPREPEAAPEESAAFITQDDVNWVKEHYQA
jgi:YqaJ-like recombinase protein